MSDCDYNEKINNLRNSIETIEELLRGIAIKKKELDIEQHELEAQLSYYEKELEKTQDRKDLLDKGIDCDDEDNWYEECQEDHSWDDIDDAEKGNENPYDY